MLRIVTLASPPQSAVGAAFVASASPPNPYFWIVSHLSVEIPGWVRGQVFATVRVDGRFICQTPHGELDTADGSEIIVAPMQQLTITWTPGISFSASGIIVVGSPHNMGGSPQGEATLFVEQVNRQGQRTG